MLRRWYFRVGQAAAFVRGDWSCWTTWGTQFRAKEDVVPHVRLVSSLHLSAVVSLKSGGARRRRRHNGSHLQTGSS